jgi:hypothetical protein
VPLFAFCPKRGFLILPANTITHILKGALKLFACFAKITVKAQNGGSTK